MQTKDLALLIVTVDIPVDHFRATIPSRHDVLCQRCIRTLQRTRHAKVQYGEVTITCQRQISRLQISMNNLKVSSEHHQSLNAAMLIEAKSLTFAEWMYFRTLKS